MRRGSSPLSAGYVVGADGGAAITSDKLVTLLELPAERMKSRGEPPEVGGWQ